MSLPTRNLLSIDRLVSSDSAREIKQLQPHLQAVREACNFYLKLEQQILLISQVSFLTSRHNKREGRFCQSFVFLFPSVYSSPTENLLL